METVKLQHINIWWLHHNFPTHKKYISILLNLLFYAQTNDMFSFNSFDLLFVALLHEDTTNDHLCYNLYPNNNCALAYNPCSFRSFYT